MSRPLLVLRPEPGAAATAARAAALGRACTVAPLFVVAPVAWSPPQPSAFDAVMLTSANALRHAGAGLGRYRHLPAYAVGAATAAAARAAGFAAVTAGDGDGAALLVRIAGDGRRHLLHLVGRAHRPLAHPDVTIDRHIVYASDRVDRLPEAAVHAIAAGAVALLHSPRAAALFRALLAVDGLPLGSIAAISAAALEAAGSGWADSAVATAPSDDALLAAAARLCD